MVPKGKDATKIERSTVIIVDIFVMYKYIERDLFALAQQEEKEFLNFY